MPFPKFARIIQLLPAHETMYAVYNSSVPKKQVAEKVILWALVEDTDGGTRIVGQTGTMLSEGGMTSDGSTGYVETLKKDVQVLLDEAPDELFK